MMVLIDNYDSFTYNLVQILSTVGADIRVFRNDAVSVNDIEAMNPQSIVISPGPCTPREAGISVELIRRLAGRRPILGVCLGHQSIGYAYGATIASASRIMHGKVSQVSHDGSALYRGLSNPFPAGRYHSLAVRRDTLPPELIVDAWSEDGEVMGLHHASAPLYGVQFHPESVLTPSGKRLLRNFVELAAGQAEKTT
ncbi:MAG: anthranilate/aminodeoxychorismate synthase component II [Candidatus Aminicenantes bacterium RBG_16_63_16]|nr:MAG: anthranilate/aminodeoxychorismate synthase component II [Candidatus Aminicenantes bacterium RBG_16_63_16]